jgi:hypothetical protein
VLLRCLEREDALRLAVFGDGEVIAVQAFDDGITFLVEDGDIEKDQA